MKEINAYDFSKVTPEFLAKLIADCPECEACCAAGICCPPLRQLLMLMAIMVRDTAGSVADAHKYALPIVASRVKAMEHQESKA